MKKLVLIILAVLLVAALAGCNYANKVPVISPNNTLTTSIPTNVPYGANDPLNLVPPSDYSRGLAPETYVPGGAGDVPNP